MTERPGRGDPDATGPVADAGMVTAELAVALPTAVLILVIALSALLAVADQMRCTDAAASAARLLARGESAEVARAAVRSVAGDRATLTVHSVAGQVTVTVRAAVALPAIGRLLHLPQVSAGFTQQLEPGAVP